MAEDLVCIKLTIGLTPVFGVASAPCLLSNKHRCRVTPRSHAILRCRGNGVGTGGSPSSLADSLAHLVLVSTLGYYISYRFCGEFS
jgi:hypothetical protein